MTLMTFFSNFFLYPLCINQNMDKNPQKIKMNFSSSLSLDHRISDGQPSWSRSSSVSSCSNDSAVYCSSRHIQSSNIHMGKRVGNEYRSNISKRTRHSSGSSVSSNMSCLSDKDVKRCSLTISPKLLTNNPIRNLEVRDSDACLLACSDIKSNNVISQKEKVSCSGNSDSVLPFRHNLRRNIRKKTCSCDCTATCTTLVVRRYKEIGKKTVKEETVISSTKVKTCMQKNSSKEMHNMTFGKNVSSKSESGRKRRSEVEKLYDSLHEIEWAKNFSPDNILRQINIRQAASCSAFGRSPSKPSTSKPHRKSKGNVKSEQNVANDKVPSETPNPDSNHKNEISSSGVHVTCAKSEAAVSDSSISKSQQKTKEYLSSNLHQSEDVLTDSDGMKSFVKENFVSHVSSQDGLNPSEISCSKSSETTCDKLVKTTNKVECLDDAQLSSASDDSVVSGNTMELIAKNFLDFDFKCHSNSGSVLDYSVTPTFFDIAEEGIRTIDACFREVGAEVVVSTCYDEECGLPLLTSVKDSQIPDKRSFLDEGPPVLEPCIVLQNENSQLAGSSKENEGILNHNPDKFLEHKLGKIYNKTANNKNGLHNGSKSSNICKITRHAELLQLWKKFRSIHSASKFMNNPLIMYAAKRILNKYVKYLRYRAKLHRLPTFKTCRYSEKSTEQINKLNSVSTDRTCEKSAEKSNVLNSLPVNKISFEKSLEHNDSLNSAISSVSNEKCTEQKLISFVSRRTPDEKIIEPLNSLNSSVKKKEITELANTNEKNAQHVNTLNSASINRTSSLIIIKEEMLHKNHVSITSSFKSQELGERSVGEPKKSTTFLKTFNGKLTLQDYSDGMVFDRCKNGSVLFHSEKEHCKPLPGTSKTESVTSSTSKSAGCSLLQQREHTLAPSSCKAVTSSKVETDECTKHDEDENVPRPTSFGFSCHYKTIRVNRNNRYTQVVLKLTRGKSIFLTLEALIELRDVVNRTGNDSNCQVLILNGIGDSFCLGLDLKPLVGPRKIKASTEMAVAVKELIEALSDFKKPLVAVVNGPAYGLGLTILNHADVTIASHTATFCMPYSFLGYIPEGGATLTLPQAVGATVAMDLLLRGRILTAREAHAIGLINHVLEAKLVPEELVSKVKVLAENSLSALETTKALVKMRLHLELSQVLETEVQMLPRMWLSAACQDALQNALRTGILAE